MIPVLKTASQTQVIPTGTTLTNLGNTERSPLGTIIARGQAYALTFGVYLCAEQPPSAPNKRAVAKPIEEWDFDPESPGVTYVLVDDIPREIEGWQAEAIMRITIVGEQSVWGRVHEIIDAMEDSAQQIVARAVLARGKMRRDSAMLATLAPLVPLTSEQVDTMFIQGRQLVA